MEELENEQITPNATPQDGGSISGTGDPVLDEKNKAKLTGIVRKMTDAGETDETIGKAVSMFKKQYGTVAKPVQPKPVVKLQGSTAVSEPAKPQPTPEQNNVDVPTTIPSKIDPNTPEVGKPTLEVGKVENEGMVPARPISYDGHPITYGETDDSGVVDFGNGIQLPASVLPKEEKNERPTIQIQDYISSVGPDGKVGETITGEQITKEAESSMYQNWEIKGWGKIVKTDEATGRPIFAPNEKGREEIKKVYEESLGYNKPLEKEENPFTDYIGDIQKKYGVLLTNDQRDQLNTQEGRDNMEIQLETDRLMKENPNQNRDQVWTQVANDYTLRNNEHSQDTAENFIAERLSQMRWGREEDTAKEAEWLKQVQGNPDMLRQFGKFLTSDDGKSYTTETNKFLSTMNQKDMKDVVNSFFQYENKQNMMNVQANMSKYKDVQAQLVNSAKAGDPETTQQLLSQLDQTGQAIQTNDKQSQDLFLQQQAVNKVFTEANYWEDKAGEYYGDVENGKRTVENVVNGSALMATGAIKRTAGGILSVFLSPMALLGDEDTKQDYYDLVKALGKPLEMKGVKLHDAFYTQEVGHDEEGVEYVRLEDGKTYQRNEKGEILYLDKDEYDPNAIKWDKTESEWSPTGIANAVQSFGWDVYMAGGIGNAITKPVSALSEYAAIGNATKNLAKAGTAIGEESAVTEGLANFTRAMRSPHTATNAGFFAQMYQDNIVKAKDAGIESDLGASLYATMNSAFDSFLITKVVPEFKMGQLNNQTRAIVKNLAENKMASASQGLYNFLKETAPNMAHTYLTMLAIETKTKLTDQTINDLQDTDFHVDNKESIFASSAKGALPLVLFSLISKSPMMLMRNKAVLNEQLVDLSKMDRDQIMVSLARQGDHIFPMLKNEAQNAYFKSYGNEVDNIAERIKEKQVLIQKVPNYEKYSDKELTEVTDLLELKQSKETELKTVDDAFKKPLKKDIENLNLQIEDLVNIKNGKEATNAKTGSQESVTGSEGETTNGETENKKTETLIKDQTTINRLKEAGVPDEVMNALPEGLKLEDRWLMGNKGDSLLTRLKDTYMIGGTYSNAITTKDGRVNSFNDGKIDFNKFVELFDGQDKVNHHTIHEVVHAATVIAMEDIKAYSNLPENLRDGRYTPSEMEAVNNIDFYIDYLKTKIKDKSKEGPNKEASTYGLTNPYEFVSEFMSNKKFREWVVNTENESGIKQTDKTNILKKVWDSILTTIGFKTKGKEIPIIDREFLNEINTDISNILKHQRRIIDEKVNNETKTESTRTEPKTEETTSETLPTEKETEVKDFDKIDLSESLGINKANEFLDNLNKKLDDFGKDNLGINIPVVVLKGAVTAMRGAVKTAKLGADVVSAGLNHVKATAWYKGLSEADKKEFESKAFLSHFDDLQSKKIAESVVKSATEGKAKPVKTQVREATGQTDKSKKITLSEKSLLRDKFKNLERGIKEGGKNVQELKKGFIDQLKNDIKGLGKDMNQAEINSLLNQVGKINDKNILEVEAMIERVIQRVEARQDRAEFSGLKKSLKRSGKSKGTSVPRNIRDLAQDATIIDERYLSEKSREEYKELLHDVRDTFRPISDDNYKMIDEVETREKLSKLYEEVEKGKVKELADKMGIDATGLTSKEILDLWREENADQYAENLSEAKKKEVRDAFVVQSEYAKMGLDMADTTDLSKVEAENLKVLKSVDFSRMPLETMKQYIKIADNIVVNGDFSNSGSIVAKVKADRNVSSLLRYINNKGISPKRISRDQNTESVLGVPISSTLNPVEWFKHGVDYMTTLNVYLEGVMGGSEAGSKLYGDSGFLDMSNARTRATIRKQNFERSYNDKMDELRKTNPKVVDGREVAKRAIFATLLQADRNSPESMDFFKQSYLEKSVKSLQDYSGNAKMDERINIINEVLGQLRDVNTKEELIDYLKINEKANYSLLKEASNAFLSHSQEFSDNSYINHGERFDPRTEEDFYLPLTRTSLTNKSMRAKTDEIKSLTRNSFLRPSQAMSGSVFTRERLARLQESETINFDFDNMITNKFGEQIYDIESAPDILKMKAVMQHPEMRNTFGATMVTLSDKALDKIMIDSGSAMNSTTAIEKTFIKAERMIRKVASVNALGGVDQYAKQYPSVIIGAGIRLGTDAGLLTKYMFTNKKDIELLKLTSIQLRGQNEGGTKRVSDEIRFDQLSLKEKNAVQRVASDLSKGLGIKIEQGREIAMLSLRLGDTNAANTTFLSYYHAYLRNHGIAEKDIDMRLEHTLVESDSVRKDALAYAQHMVNTTQTSSDLSEGSKMATSNSVGAKILSSMIIPFSSFSNNAMIRFMKAVGNIKRNPKENIQEAAASFIEIVAFQSIKAMALAPAMGFLGNTIFGNKDDEDENLVDWSKAINKTASGVIGDLNPMPDSFDIDAINYMLYLQNRDGIAERIGWEGDFTYRDYDLWRKKAGMNAKKTGESLELPYKFYRFGDQDGWDIANGGMADKGLYEIPVKQAERTYEAWQVLTTGKTEEYNPYGQKTKFDFKDESKSLLAFYTLYETAATIGLSDATSRRLLEREFDKRKRESKVVKDKKKGQKKRKSGSDYGKL